MASNAQADPRKWDALLSQHQNVLEEHLKLWDSVRKHSNPGTNPYVTAERCWTDTSNMIENFERLQTSFEPREKTPISTKRRQAAQEEAPLSHEDASAGDTKSIKRRRTGESSRPAHEVSDGDDEDLFTIDTKPTSIEDLLSKATQPKQPAKHTGKRKLSEVKEVHAIGLNVPSASRTSSNPVTSSKKVKRAVHEGNDGSKLDNEANNNDDDSDSAPTSDQEDEEDAEIIVKLTAKQAEKAAKKQLKRERKRKRESTPSLEDHAQADVQPFKKKRQKGSHSKSNSGGSAPEASSAVKQNPKEKKKHKFRPKHKSQGSRKEKRK